MRQSILRTPKTQSLCSNSAHLWAPEKAGVVKPLLILKVSPFQGHPKTQRLFSNFAPSLAADKVGVV